MLRADSGFARKANDVDYLFGLARNACPAAQVVDALAEAEADSERSGTPARRFADFMRFTRNSWSRERRVVAKAEWPHGKANPRFVIASLAAGAYDARSPDEDLYRQRGEMENRIEDANSTRAPMAPRRTAGAPTDPACGSRR